MSMPTLRQFESADIQPGGFDHEAHVYIAWRYLQRHPLLKAIELYRAGLQNLVKKFGAESKYHETITWFFMVSISERMNGAGARNWGAFKASNPELFGESATWLARHYSAERLASSQARQRFVLPDRIGG